MSAMDITERLSGAAIGIWRSLCELVNRRCQFYDESEAGQGWAEEMKNGCPRGGYC